MYLLSRSDQLVQIMDDRLCFCFGNADYLRDESWEHFLISILMTRQKIEYQGKLKG